MSLVDHDWEVIEGCGISGCQMTGPHGHGTEAIYPGSVRMPPMARGRSLDDLLVAAFQAGQAHGTYLTSMLAAEECGLSREDLAALRAPSYAEWRADLLPLPDTGLDRWDDTRV